MRFIFALVAILSVSLSAFSKDVSVSGYYRKNGTYVKPYHRTSPDAYKWNNYGSAAASEKNVPANMRDKDKDGTPNYLDHDDDNNGVSDDDEK